ncbi:MAG: KamA family radical SAM protein [Myxococcota bacterium]|nr:KamA family radical SAM protein [Myxococcota bacterium]
MRPEGIGEADWNDAGWQMRHRIRDAEGLRAFIHPTDDEIRAVAALADRFRFVITPYYASLMDPDDPECPIRRQVVPRMAELDDPAGLADPLDEVAHSPVKNVVRVYRDRIAFCVNNECALYCRYCLRKRMVGEPSWAMKKRELGLALDWIRATPEIRDVLLTGGDPLVFSDERLDWLLGELRGIPHVEIIRLGTRLPVTLPARITPELCRVLEAHHPVWLNTHFNHPRELTPEAAAACDRLTRAGVPVGNQSVLLRGINDDAETMKALCEGLVRLRVRPYYCYQAQLLEGTAHFRVPVERGLEIFRALRGRTSGYAIPLYVLDTPYGKVPLTHAYLRGREGDDIVVESYDGRLWREPNPLDDPEAPADPEASGDPAAPADPEAPDET